MNTKQQVVGYIPRILFRFYLYLKNRFDPPKPIPEEEKICQEICLNLIQKESSFLTIAPVSSRRYIKNDDKGVFIVISERTIKLVNHIYSYTVYCENDELYEELLKNFDLELEKRKNDLELEIQSNIQHSLKKILENVK